MITIFTRQRISFLCSLLSITALCTGCSTSTQTPSEEQPTEDIALESTSEINTEAIEESTAVPELQAQNFSDIDFTVIDIQQSIQTILDNDEYYPNITDVIVTDDYREFTILLNGSSIDTYESMLVMSFFTVGDAYQKAQGVPDEHVNTIVRYQDATTGTVISETGSSD